MQNRRFPDVRQVGRSLLVLFVAVDYLLVTLVILLFASGLLDPIARATGGLINRALLGNLPLILFAVAIVMLWLGKLRASDLGLVWSKLLPGLTFTVGLWLLVQLTQLALGLAVNGAATPAPEWSQLGVLGMIGVLIGQIFGNALYEDISYRGFLLPQVLQRLNNWWPRQSTRAVVVALIITQGLFALRHIPIDTLNGFSLADTALDLPVRMAIGIVLALLYLRTGNLFMVIGAHTLFNAPTSLFAPTLLSASDLALVFTVLALVVWPVLTQRHGKHTQQGVIASS